MDIDTFGQCIDYLTATTGKRSAIEVALPAITTALGIVIGFLVNRFHDFHKERKDNKRKNDAIMEEAKRLKKLSAMAFRGAITVVDSVQLNKIPANYYFPNDITPYCLTEYFIQVAHNYSESRRISAFTLLPAISVLNKFMLPFYDNSEKLDRPDNIYSAAMMVAHQAAQCYLISEAFINDTEMPATVTILEVGLIVTPDSTYINSVVQYRQE